MPRQRLAKLDPARREQLLTAAGEEFATFGYDRASLNRIIGKLELSKGQFYYYFDDKLDLFAAVLERAWMLAVPDAMPDIERLQAATYWPAIERIAEISRGMLRELPWYARVWRPLYDPPADLRARRVALKMLERANEQRRALIRRGQALGCVREDLPEDLLLAAAFGMRSAIDRWFFDSWQTLSPQQRHALPPLMLDLLRRVLEPPRPASRRTKAASR